MEIEEVEVVVVEVDTTSELLLVVVLLLLILQDEDLLLEVVILPLGGKLDLEVVEATILATGGSAPLAIALGICFSEADRGILEAAVALFLEGPDRAAIDMRRVRLTPACPGDLLGDGLAMPLTSIFKRFSRVLCLRFLIFRVLDGEAFSGVLINLNEVPSSHCSGSDRTELRLRRCPLAGGIIYW